MANPTKDQLKTLIAVEAEGDADFGHICQETLEDCEAMGWIESSPDFRYVLAQRGREILGLVRT